MQHTLASERQWGHMGRAMVSWPRPLSCLTSSAFTLPSSPSLPGVPNDIVTRDCTPKPGDRQGVLTILLSSKACSERNRPASGPQLGRGELLSRSFGSTASPLLLISAIDVFTLQRAQQSNSYTRHHSLTLGVACFSVRFIF